MKKVICLMLAILLATTLVSAVELASKDGGKYSCDSCTLKKSVMSCGKSCTVIYEKDSKQVLKILLTSADLHFNNSRLDYVKVMQKPKVPYSIDGILLPGLNKGDKILFTADKNYPAKDYTQIRLLTLGWASRVKGKIPALTLCDQKFERVMGGPSGSEFFIIKKKGEKTCSIPYYKLYTLYESGLNKRSIEYLEGYQYKCGNLTFRARGGNLRWLVCNVTSKETILDCKSKKCKTSEFIVRMEDGGRQPVKVDKNSKFEWIRLVEGDVKKMRIKAENVKIADAEITLNSSSVKDFYFDIIHWDEIMLSKNFIVMHSGKVKPSSDKFTYILKRPEFKFHGFFIEIDKGKVNAVMTSEDIYSGALAKLKRESSFGLRGISYMLTQIKSLKAKVNYYRKEITLTPFKQYNMGISFDNLMKKVKKGVSSNDNFKLVTDPIDGRKRVKSVTDYLNGNVKDKRLDVEALKEKAKKDMVGSRCRMKTSVRDTTWNRIVKSKSTKTKRTYYDILNDLPISALQKATLTGVMAAESGGVPTVISSTGCVGLYQFCSGSARGVAGPCYFNRRSKCYVCAPKGCNVKDNRKEPEIAIPGGLVALKMKLKVLHNLCRTTSSEDDKLKFAVTAYNAGEGPVCLGIKATKKKDSIGFYNPTFDEFIKKMDAKLLAKIPFYRSSIWDDAKRKKKALGLKCYVQDIMYYRTEYVSQFMIGRIKPPVKKAVLGEMGEIPEEITVGQEKEVSPVTLIGNSHMVGFKRYYKNNVQGLLLEDSDKSSSDKMRCKKCDLFSFEGRHVLDMRNKRKKIMKEMDKLGSNIAILYEGTNSLWMGKSKIKGYIAEIVQDFHKGGKKIYLVEMPLGVEGAAKFLTKSKIDYYNKMITEVGADGVIAAKNVPWKKGKLHGYHKETFPYFLERYKKVLA